MVIQGLGVVGWNFRQICATAAKMMEKKMMEK